MNIFLPEMKIRFVEAQELHPDLEHVRNPSLAGDYGNLIMRSKGAGINKRLFRFFPNKLLSLFKSNI